MLAITMSGALEPVLIDEDFQSTVHAMNNAAVQGKEFFISRDPDGEPVGFRMHNILTIKETHE